MIGWTGLNVVVDTIIKCHFSSLQNVYLKWADYSQYVNHVYDSTVVTTLLQTEVITEEGSPFKRVVIEK